MRPSGRSTGNRPVRRHVLHKDYMKALFKAHSLSRVGRLPSAGRWHHLPTLRAAAGLWREQPPAKRAARDRLAY